MTTEMKATMTGCLLVQMSAHMTADMWVKMMARTMDWLSSLSLVETLAEMMVMMMEC